jgi:hypothetical protein
VVNVKKLCPVTLTSIQDGRLQWTLWGKNVLKSSPLKPVGQYQRRLLNIFSIGSYVKTKLSHGGHLEFPIGKRFTSLVQDHPMIIPALARSEGIFFHFFVMAKHLSVR